MTATSASTSHQAPEKKQRTAKQNAVRRKAIRERLSHKPRGFPAFSLVGSKTPRVQQSSSQHETRQQKEHASKIAAFHTLEKQLVNTTDPAERANILAKQAELGGLEQYQEASLKGAKSGGETSKWFIQEMEKRHGRKQGFRLLDVGAIAGTSYKKYTSIVPTYIDLNPQAEHVIKADFLEFPEPDEPFDAVCLSLVLNFVGDLQKRAEMLRRARTLVKDGGHLYLVLPLACVQNSRYIDHERLTGILKTLGWSVEVQRDSALLTYWLLQKSPDVDSNKWPRKEVRGGVKRNNFVIIVK